MAAFVNIFPSTYLHLSTLLGVGCFVLVEAKIFYLIHMAFIIENFVFEIQHTLHVQYKIFQTLFKVMHHQKMTLKHFEHKDKYDRLVEF